MKPEIDILGISVKTFGVMFALGFLACGAVVWRRLRELEKPVDWAYEIVFAALIGGGLGARGRGAGELRMFDMCATALALGYGIGRIGCQVSGDGDYGIRSSLPWAMGYPHGTVPTRPGGK